MYRFHTREDGNLMLSLLVAIVVGGLALTFLSTVLAGQNKVQHNRSYSQAINGAEAGVQQAVTYISAMDRNDPRNFVSTADLPATVDPNLGGVDVEWEATRVFAGLAWEITGTGDANGVTRRVEALATRNVTFFLAAFGASQVTIRGASSSVTSYDDTSGNTGNGAVGGNAGISIIGNNTDYDLMMLLGPAADCTAVCDADKMQGFAEAFDVAALEQEIQAGMDEHCPSGSFESYTPAMGPLQGGETYCFTSITVQGTGGGAQPLVVEGGSADNPAIVYVTGDIFFGGHSRVNCGPSGNGCTLANRPDSGSLQIYTLGDTIDIRQQSKMAVALAAPKAACGSTTSNAGVDVFGALICNGFENQGNWNFHFDDRLVDLGTGQYDVTEWREEVGDSTSF